MRYEGTVYRPPSEAGSLIIQLTIGCARNTCTFCAMYKDKNFRIRPLEDVVEDLQMAREYYSRIKVKRVFLADGDALIVKTADLLYILGKVKELFPECERISMYGAPKDILGKTPEELKTLKEAGLDMVYMGIESGDDEVLKFVKKGATQAEMIEAGKKIKDAGMILSVTLISGLGGRKYLKEHAINSAKVITEIKPEYVGFLTLLVEEGTPMYDQLKNGEIELLKPQEVLEEMKLFVSNVDSEGTVFRANHASNYIPLGGTFNRDKESLLAQITEAEKRNTFKSDYFRAL
ncbi:radical SAM protein [Tyzzerella sp. An114]|uniref:radical SAM protein n=1 Tax=Tyzzerella sp. An114 TaxID=1965545 RepID=UPI000B452596|nr:radical SAM protein [Tyzzerella sp. An114]OUQ59255.1 radical SAM protein [Tyzzerella sp. An114]